LREVDRVVFAEIVFPGWDPVAFHLGPLAIRWYGLAYLAGFLIAGWLLDRMVRDRFLPLTTAAVSDLVGWLVVGVLIGGRLGYALFYDPGMFLRPLELLKVWEGGLSFHGGLTGVVVASVLFARRRKVSWRRLADGLALAAPAGILLVRIANFVNGELFGRLAPAGLPWAMRFPTDPRAQALVPDLARGGGMNWHAGFAALRASGEWAALAAQIPLRHPSQLYEATLEGLVIGVVLWWVYARRRATLRPGTLAAMFLMLYAAARFLIEFTRQPDVQFISATHPLGTVLGPFSMGQLLSVLVGVCGVVLLRWGGSPGERSREGNLPL
jgi:phosphatidylglycerol:prolipoprotein diacylglycerol transferase